MIVLYYLPRLTRWSSSWYPAFNQVISAINGYTGKVCQPDKITIFAGFKKVTISRTQCFSYLVVLTDIPSL